jgi:hypothetical protein
MDIEEAIKSYYKLKKRYNSKYNSNKSKIIKSDVSIKEKQIRLNNYKRKCVKCGSPFGSIFEKQENILIARCGNTSNPCKLDIRIDVGSYENLLTLYETINTDLETTKRAIINIKLKVLYGLDDENYVEKEFNKIKEIYQSLNGALEKVIGQMQYKNMIEVDDLTASEKVDKNTILNLNDVKIKNTIINLKELITEFSNETMVEKRISLLDEAIDLYINKLQILLKKQRELRYDVATMVDDGRGVNKLVQIKQLFENMEFVITQPKILSNKK